VIGAEEKREQRKKKAWKIELDWGWHVQNCAEQRHCSYVSKRVDTDLRRKGVTLAGQLSSAAIKTRGLPDCYHHEEGRSEAVKEASR
jgi:hypothetical protein